MQEVREGGGRGLGRGGGAAGATAGRKDLSQLGLFIGSLDHVHGSQHLTMLEVWTDIHGDEAFLTGGVGTSKDSIFMVFLLFNIPNGPSLFQSPYGASASPRALGGHGGAIRPLEALGNGCAMTYMYLTYAPIATRPWQGRALLVPQGVERGGLRRAPQGARWGAGLFVPGNGGSYKQVHSLGAESHRAYQRGPLKHTHYQEASLLPTEVVGGEMLENMDGFVLPSQYTRMPDWFAVDLKGEHIAMDGRIIEEHTEYVVIDAVNDFVLVTTCGTATIFGSSIFTGQ